MLSALKFSFNTLLMPIGLKPEGLAALVNIKLMKELHENRYGPHHLQPQTILTAATIRFFRSPCSRASGNAFT